MKARSKFGVDQSEAGKQKRTDAGGKVFDSVSEMQYADYLCQEGIRYMLQPVFVLQGKFTGKYGSVRAIEYRADFQIGNIVIDVKGMETTEFKIKKKMFAKLFPEHTLILVRKSGKKWNHYVYQLPTKTKKIQPKTIWEILDEHK